MCTRLNVRVTILLKPFSTQERSFCELEVLSVQNKLLTSGTFRFLFRNAPIAINLKHLQMEQGRYLICTICGGFTTAYRTYAASLELDVQKRKPMSHLNMLMFNESSLQFIFVLLSKQVDIVIRGFRRRNKRVLLLEFERRCL